MTSDTGVLGFKPQSRATTTIGLLPGVSGCSGWSRRLKDLIGLHMADLGGPEAVSAAEASIIRRAATLTCELEQLEVRFAADGATPEQLDLYSRASNTLRRHLESIGLKRVPRDLNPKNIDEIAVAIDAA